ncbi:MAG: hypothetical protein LBP33_13130 [Candidatus Adiutrix sp.]|jgi:Flp pilus assembly CpaE family ATPase|nr:hypothetical protein [Candidatus Adiutrix sp.]
MKSKAMGREQETEISVGFFMRDTELAQALRPLLETSGISPGIMAEMKGDGFSMPKVPAAEMLRLSAVLIDVSRQANPVAVLTELRERCVGGTVIVALGGENSLNFYRQMRAAGAHEYFAHPVPADELAQALQQLLKPETGAARFRGRIVAVCGTHGGVGSGLFSAGIGAAISQSYGRRSIVVDADFSTPAVGLYLGVDQPGSLGILLEESDRLDKVLLDQVIQQPQEMLDLLDDYDDLDVIRRYSAEEADSLIGMLSDQYRYQIWRCSGDSRILTASVLRRANVVILMVAGNLASARAAQNTLRWLADNNKGARVIPVCNSPSPHPPIPASTLEEALERPMAYVVPYQRALGEAVLRNVPGHSPAHCLHKYFMQISRDILGVRQGGKLWKRRLFK